MSNKKTALSLAARGEKVLWLEPNRMLARDAFNKSKDITLQEFASKIEKIQSVNGRESIKFEGGGSIDFMHGESGPRVLRSIGGYSALFVRPPLRELLAAEMFEPKMKPVRFGTEPFVIELARRVQPFGWGPSKKI